jgi:hypothetical protein
LVSYGISARAVLSGAIAFVRLAVQPTLIYLAIMIGAIGLGGQIVDRVLRLPCSSVEFWVFSAGIGLAALSFLMLILGAVGGYYTWVVVLLLALEGILAIDGLARRSWRRFLHVPTQTLELSNPVTALLLGVSVLSLLYVIVANVLVPPLASDELAYHLAIPKMYAQQHTLAYIPFIVYSNWPLATEMLFIVPLLLGSDLAAHWVTWGMHVLTGGLVFQLARQAFDTRTGWLALAIFTTIPMVEVLAGTALIETALAFYTFLAVYAFWRWQTSQCKTWLAVSAMMSGAVAATKLSGAGVTVLLGVLSALFGVYNSRVNKRSALWYFVIFGILSLAIALPWYVKAWAQTGNPFWPAAIEYLGARDWDALGTRYITDFIRLPNLPWTFQNWLMLPWYVTTSGSRFGASYIIGPMLLATSGLAVITFGRQRQTRPALAFLGLFVLGFYTSWFLTTHQTRFLMPVVPVLAIASGAGIRELTRGSGRIASVLLAAVLVYLMSQTMLFSSQRQTVLASRANYLVGTQSSEEFLRQSLNVYPAIEIANRIVPEDERVILAPWEPRGYYLEREYLWANPVSQRYLRMEQLASVQEFRQWLRENKITFVLYNPTRVYTYVEYWGKINFIWERLLNKYGELVFEQSGIQLYRLRTEPVSP